MNETVDYLFYGTEGCHLCDMAEQVIALAMTPRESVEYVDIAFDDALAERYSLSIPVLHCERSHNDLCWPFTSEQVRTFFEQN